MSTIVVYVFHEFSKVQSTPDNLIRIIWYRLFSFGQPHIAKFLDLEESNCLFLPPGLNTITVVAFPTPLAVSARNFAPHK